MSSAAIPSWLEIWISFTWILTKISQLMVFECLWMCFCKHLRTHDHEEGHKVQKAQRCETSKFTKTYGEITSYYLHSAEDRASNHKMKIVASYEGQKHAWKKKSVLTASSQPIHVNHSTTPTAAKKVMKIFLSLQRATQETQETQDLITPDAACRLKAKNASSTP